MLYFDRIDVSQGIDVNKIMASNIKNKFGSEAVYNKKFFENQNIKSHLLRWTLIILV